MPNPLTGDYQAVLQVSGATVNRLLATLHQNASTNPAVPSFPHVMRLNLGQPPIEGVRGHVQAQVGVPRVSLLHGVSDRFQLAVGVRAWFQPLHGSAVFPNFIHGTVHAEYRLEAIDPHCPGWRRDAAEYLWIRVVRESVRFEGTAIEDRRLFQLELNPIAVDPAPVIAKVTRQIAYLLAKRFEATPHKVASGFRRGEMITLNPGGADPAVALPIGLSGPPSGNIGSIAQVVLGGADLAVAVDAAAVFQIAQPLLQKIAAFAPVVPVHVTLPLKDFDTVYRVAVQMPTLAWLPMGAHAVVRITAHGTAKTNSVIADATFDVVQDVQLHFDGGTGRLRLQPAWGSVKVHTSGLYHGTVNSRVHQAISSFLGPTVQAACAGAQATLDQMTETTPLTTQLRTLDPNASVRLDAAEFVPGGFVLRGTIEVSPRHAPVVTTEITTAQDAHSALDSWLPGGRIDRFDWTWGWPYASAGGRAATRDRFLLRRNAGAVGRWGLIADSDTPVPGIDGSGSLCLVISGVQVDATTGALVRVTSTRRCTRFGFHGVVAINGGLHLPHIPELSKDVPFPQLAVQSAALPRGRQGTNVLLLYAGGAWHDDLVRTALEGITRCARFDAGLSLLVLFGAGALGTTDSPLMAEINHMARRAGVPVHVNEDIDGAWARTFGIHEPAAAWRLVHPNGAVPWSHDGALTPEALASVLDDRLVAGVVPRFEAVQQKYAVGDTISLGTLLHTLDNDSPCPPTSLTRSHVEAVVTFVRRESAASMAHLRALAQRHGREAPDGDAVQVVMVVDGADADQARALQRELGDAFIAVPDPRGDVTARFEVRVWPSTLTLDRRGRVTAASHGIPSEGDPGDEEPAAAEPEDEEGGAGQAPA